MSSTGRLEGNREASRARIWWVVAGVLLAIAAGFLVVGLQGRQLALSGPPVVPDATPAASAAASATATVQKPTAVAPLKAASAPVSLRIPAIGVSVPVSTLGLMSDGTVEVPTDFAKVGWFRLGPTPGQVGSSVFLGHVDSHNGPAVFYRIRELKPGDRVDVTLANGKVAHFAVNKVAMYLKSKFPAQLVYGSHGYSALQLVTCGGVFDQKAGSYLSNVVAFTTLVSTTGA